MVVTPDGMGTLSLTTDKWSIGTGMTNDVVRNAIIIHGGVDDYTTQPTGNAGNGRSLQQDQPQSVAASESKVPEERA